MMHNPHERDHDDEPKEPDLPGHLAFTALLVGFSNSVAKLTPGPFSNSVENLRKEFRATITAWQTSDTTLSRQEQNAARAKARALLRSRQIAAQQLAEHEAKINPPMPEINTTEDNYDDF